MACACFVSEEMILLKREMVAAILGGIGRTSKEALAKVGTQLQEMELKPGELEKWSRGGRR